MLYCLNPNCNNPQNPDNTNYCISCGTKITPILRGKYRIISSLGAGGFGKTYLAEDMDRRGANCVVKQFAPAPGMQSNPQILQKATELFNQEADRLLQLEEHPQIPNLYAYFEEENYLYLVQQFVKGKTLMAELEQGTFTEKQIREILQDILPILDFIHKHKVIHRDIKPENIIRRESDNKLVLIDFGIAKQGVGTILTRQGTIVGTSGYAPIEQVMRGVVYPASDLYSLAATCIRLLTGCLPNDDGYDQLYDSFQGCWVWRKCLPESISVSEQLGEILDNLLQDMVKDRYQSAAEVLAALTFSSSAAVPPAKPAGISTPPPSNLNSPLINNYVAAQTSTQIQKNLDLQIFNFEIITVNDRGEITNKQTRQAEYLSENLGNSIILEMVSIPGGTFMMGSSDGEGYDGKKNQHQVTVKPFFIGKFTVTQAQWQAVAALSKIKIDLNTDPSDFKGENRPVEKVNWYEAIEFCARLSQKTGKKYRLPSEAEWEYACRAGTTTPFHFGETITTDLANFDGNKPYAAAPKGIYREKTTDVGSFPPNAFGLYDMHGNVWEWCADNWHRNYNNAPTDGSVWQGGDNTYRMLRGGSWFSIPRDCRAAFRYWNEPGRRYWDCGFRVAFSPQWTP